MTWIQDSNSLGVLLHRIFVTMAIPYYVTGGLAAIAYGEPRTTTDIDMVLSLPRSSADALTQSLESNGFYVPSTDDIKSGRMDTLGVTHIESVSRADLIFGGSDEFSQIKFERRILLQVPGGELYFSSPEDVILSKLRWRKQSRSDKQWRDILGILKVQGNSLDFNYLQQWADTLDVSDDLVQSLVESGL